MDFNERLFETHGSWAAKYRFEKESYPVFFEQVCQLVEVTTKAILERSLCSESYGWSLDFLETGFALLQYETASRLVKKDFLKAVIAYHEAIMQQASLSRSYEQPGRKPKSPKRGFGK